MILQELIIIHNCIYSSFGIKVNFRNHIVTKFKNMNLGKANLLLKKKILLFLIITIKARVDVSIGTDIVKVLVIRLLKFKQLLKMAIVLFQAWIIFCCFVEICKCVIAFCMQ